MNRLHKPFGCIHVCFLGCIRKGSSFTQFRRSFGVGLPGMSSGQPSGSTADGEVLFETVNEKGIITLNRPNVLNAVNMSMIREIFTTLREWESLNMQFVIIKATTGGKAFCAGGDIRSVTDSVKSGTSFYKDFYKEASDLNNLIGTLRIPYIALIDGITMGGGVGLSINGPYRVGTERTLFAMPETAIGLFPDVGGTYFLPRLKGKLGLYLGLTGFRLKGGDVQKAGLATHMCSSSMLPSLEQDLISLSSNKPQDIEKVLQKYHSQLPGIKQPFSLEPKIEEINSLFSADSVEDIMDNLKKAGNDWATKTAETLERMSPTSLKLTLRALKEGASLDLQECLQMEYRLTQRCCEDHDFMEGVRALLVDKDQNPKWKPDSLADVTDSTLERYFSPLSPGRELNLRINVNK